MLQSGRPVTTPKILILLGVVSLAMAPGCTAKVDVSPQGVMTRPVSEPPSRKVSLAISPEVSSHRQSARRIVGFGDTLIVEYRLGDALVETINHAVASHVGNPVRADEADCVADTDALILVELAKPTYLDIHWVDRFFNVGGGATMEIALRVVGRQCCASGDSWAFAAIGYGTSEHTQTLFNWPDETEFQPAADAALVDLAGNLAAGLSERAASWDLAADPECER